MSEHIIETLREKGLRPTRQRIMIAKMIFSGKNRHVSPEMLADEIAEAGGHIALGTIYNTLRQFSDAGLLTQLSGLGDRLVYDTNLSFHHHFLDVDTGELTDVPAGQIAISGMPHMPDGFSLDAVDVTIRIKHQTKTTSKL